MVGASVAPILRFRLVSVDRCFVSFLDLRGDEEVELLSDVGSLLIRNVVGRVVVCFIDVEASRHRAYGPGVLRLCISYLHRLGYVAFLAVGGWASEVPCDC